MLHLLQTIYLPETGKVQPFTVVPRSAVYLDCDHLTLRSGAARPIQGRILSFSGFSLVEEHVSIGAVAYFGDSTVMLVKLVAVL